MLALMWLWGLYTIVGRHEVALPYGERGRRVDPGNPIWISADGASEYFRANFAAASRELREIAKSHPDNLIARFWGALSMAVEGEPGAAVTLEQIARDAPEQGIHRIGLALAHALSGDEDATERALTPALLAWARHDFELSLHVAEVYGLLQRRQHALDWLEHAVDAGFINHPFLIRDRLLDSLRGTERFERLMERAKREWETFDA